ncbi:hypothetical protein P879_06492 [Paragonimus westermani]|uniref:Uncharacterized protein n=1 Tax=Paragonimus westermani TaxID=34504 RepID=A0A8T0D2D1_9TREM|nr:hypothetical protein P879_06492 [Paragonimus westermani]
MSVAVANQLVNHAKSESGSRIKALLYDTACLVFETVADEQAKVIKSSPFRSRSAATRTMDLVQERLARCQLGAIDCCLVLNEPERALQMIRKWNVTPDQTISTEVPAKKFFNLLARQSSASTAAGILSQLLLDLKMNWPQIIQFVEDAICCSSERRVQHHDQDVVPTSEMIVTLLAATLNMFMENTHLKVKSVCLDQPEEITRIVQQIGQQSLHFWSTLTESLPRRDSQQDTMTDTSNHHTNGCPDRMVYLVQLVTAALLEFTNSAEETTVHGHDD